MGIYKEFILIFILMAISAFFSMGEISLASSRKIKLQLLADSGNKTAEKIMNLQSNPGNFFTTVQIGLNFVAILAGIIGDNLLTPILSPFIENTTLLSFISFIFVTGLFIQFADLIPKRIAMIFPEKVALQVVPFVCIVIKIISPIVWFFNTIANSTLKLFNVPLYREDLITQDDIFAIVDAGAEAGVVHTKEHHLIENVFELDQRKISSIMTLRDDIVFFNISENEDSIKEKIVNSPHSKFLICNNDLDYILGYVNSRDILPRILKGESSGLNNISEITNKNILIVPNTLTLSEMLDRFRESREDFAAIINEYANVVGVVTLNDVISTLMGDVVFSEQEDYIVVRDENSWLIDGVTPIIDVKKFLDIDFFPEEDTYDTIAGFVIYMLKNIPRKGATITYSGYSFEVVDVDNFKIDQLLVIKI